MEYLKFSGSEISEFLSLNTRNKETQNWKNKKLNLEKISEVNESMFQTKNSKSHWILSPDSLPELNSPKAPSKFLVKFMRDLAKKDKIYTYFTTQAFVSGILKKTCKQYSEPFMKTSQRKNHPKLVMITRENSDNESLISDSSFTSRSQRSIINQQKRARVSKLFFEQIRRAPPSPSSISRSSSSKPSTVQTSRLRPGQKKKGVLDPEDSKLNSIFLQITQGKKLQISTKDFQIYLQKRYPEKMAETMAKHFQFKEVTFEKYYLEMAKFIKLSELKQLRFCFDILDFDKDQKISYKDAFTALELRNDNYYDTDLVIIKEMLILKREGRLDNKKLLRRKSTFSLMKEKIEEKLKKPIILEEKVENDGFLTFKEFCMIKFNGRPQILRDFLDFTTGYDLLKEIGMKIPVSLHKVRSSQFIVMDMNLSPDFHETLRKNDKYEYYCSLDSVMSLYSKSLLDDMLEKFKYLQSPDRLKYKVITKDSMVSKLVNII